MSARLSLAPDPRQQPLPVRYRIVSMRSRPDRSEIVHYTVIGVPSALVVLLGGAAGLMGATVLVWRWQPRRDPRPRPSTGSDT